MTRKESYRLREELYNAAAKHYADAKAPSSTRMVVIRRDGATVSEHFHKLSLEPSTRDSRVVIHRDGSATIKLRNHYRRLATYGWTATTGLERKLKPARVSDLALALMLDDPDISWRSAWNVAAAERRRGWLVAA